MMENIDKSNFRQFIINSPSQFEVGISLTKNIKPGEGFSFVTVSGMGGSALPANLLDVYCKSLFEKYKEYKPFQIFVNRYYSLPFQSKNSNTLNILASYSGNTEETLSSLNELKNANLPFVGISSAGELEKICKESGRPHVKLPVPYPNFQPRMGTGYFFGVMFSLLVKSGLVPDLTTDIVRSAKNLSNIMEKYEIMGKELAGKLLGKTIIIYSSEKYKSVAMVWKIKFNENSKTPAFWNFFPELNHNEMVGFSNPESKFFVIMLKDETDNPKNLKRYEVTANLLRKKGIESEIINMEGEDVFTKMFSGILLADWTSYYLALKYKLDPTPVDMVEDLKKTLIS